MNTEFIVYCTEAKWNPGGHPNFRGAQFPQIAISKHFAETIFVDQEFRVYGNLNFRELNFRGLLKSVKTAKITLFENLDVYSIIRRIIPELLAHPYF